MSYFFSNVVNLTNISASPQSSVKLGQQLSDTAARSFLC